jgi:ubiquinone/menaquinone biosynthesis C-methylase UbiE
MVAIGREKMAGLGNVHLQETDGAHLGMFADRVFDFAFSYAVFQRVPLREVIVSYFREVHRILKPGCLFKFQVQGAAIGETQHMGRCGILDRGDAGSRPRDRLRISS